ncbi:putative transcription factor interactor and regulator C3H-WRC/GRF family [Lupinus albus]|uniref:Growth-regulating factor n=1 Tax=Lupinus albus TaxID=3870 RepID=A0A6A4QLY4_LUPAL|nr:putative transcription factor interactor and regulator C3H-WRC/GRF family [Lupinus albus]
MNLPPPMSTAFTAVQWQELEHQALIFSYFTAGITVPPHLLRHPSLGYYSYDVKKIDLEPGRCRRTDGKKWRCSRDAHPNSKYCERHMIRRRYSSRKLVESSQSIAAAAAALHSKSVEGVLASGSRGDSGNGTFQSLPLHTSGSCEGFTLGNNNRFCQLQMEPFPSDLVSKKEYRFGPNFEADGHNYITKDLGTARYEGNFTSDGIWSHMSQVSSNSVSESRNSSTVINNYFQQQTLRDTNPLNIAAMHSEQHVSIGHLSSAGCMKQEYQPPPSLYWKKGQGSPAAEYRPGIDFNCNPDVNVDRGGSLYK